MLSETDFTVKAIRRTGLDGWMGLEISEQGYAKSTFGARTRMQVLDLGSRDLEPRCTDVLIMH